MKEGGLFTILDNCLQKISDFSKTNEIRVIALVCDENLFKYPNIEYIAFPKAKKSWIARLYYEYIYFNKLSKTIKPNVWLSLHDVSPNVKAKRSLFIFTILRYFTNQLSRIGNLIIKLEFSPYYTST